MTKSYIDAGHNNPPPEAEIGLKIDELFDLLSDSTGESGVTSDEQEAAIDALLDEFRAAAKALDAARTAEKKPVLEMGRAIDARFKPVIDKASAGADECKRLLTPWRQAKQKAADDAARKAREEAERIEAEAIAARKDATDLADKWAAELQIKTADKLRKEADRKDASPTGLRTTYAAEVTSYRDATLHYMKLYPQEFMALVDRLAANDARGSRGKVPGVVFVERKTAV